MNSDEESLRGCGSTKGNGGPRRLLQQANSTYYSTNIQLPSSSGSSLRRPFAGELPLPMQGTRAYEIAQQEQLQRLFDESLCVLLRRTGAEAMRQRILSVVQQQAADMLSLDASLSSVWEGMTSAIMGADTPDSALSQVPPDLRSILASSTIPDDILSGRLVGGDATSKGPASADASSNRRLVSVGCNTIDRGESEKDSLIATLKKGKAEADRRIDELKKEVANLKRQLGLRSAAPTVGAAAGAVLFPIFSPTGGSSSTAGACDSPPDVAVLPSLSAQQQSSAQTPKDSRSFAGVHLPSVKTVTIGANFANSSTSEPPTPHGQLMSAPSLSDGGFLVGLSPTHEITPSHRRGGGGGGGARPRAGSLSVRSALQRLHQQIKELRGKLAAVKTGVRAFSFAEVFAQFTQHVIPPMHNLTTSNVRLIDRNFMLEKTCLEFLSRLGTMPDLNSTEGYLPEGGPLHVGSYSMMDDRRFNDWIGKLQSTFAIKAGKVQELIKSLSCDATRNFEQSSGSKRELNGLDERCQTLEALVVEAECIIVGGLSDVLDGLQLQQTRKPEYSALLRTILETNEEVRIGCTIGGWVTKPPARVKVNMWRQRRTEAIQRLERMLLQDLHHFVSGGAAKGQLRTRIASLREVAQCLSKLHLMPTSRQSVMAFTAIDTVPVGQTSSPPPSTQQQQQQQSSASVPQGTSDLTMPPPSIDALQHHLQRRAVPQQQTGGTAGDELPLLPEFSTPTRHERRASSVSVTSPLSTPSGASFSLVHSTPPPPITPVSANGGMQSPPPAQRRRSVSNMAGGVPAPASRLTAALGPSQRSLSPLQ